MVIVVVALVGDGCGRSCCGGLVQVGICRIGACWSSVR